MERFAKIPIYGYKRISKRVSVITPQRGFSDRIMMLQETIQFLSDKRFSYFISFLIAGIVAVIAAFQWDSVVGRSPD